MFYFIDHVRAGVRQRRGAAGQGVRVDYAEEPCSVLRCSVNTDPSSVCSRRPSSLVLVLFPLITMTTYDDDNWFNMGGVLLIVMDVIRCVRERKGK